MKVRFTNEMIDAAAEGRPKGYRQALARIAVARDGGGMTFETTSPAYQRFANRWRRSGGLGDTFGKITAAVGITPCGGCKKRQEALNQWVPFET